MPEIKNLTDKNGNIVYPNTIAEAVTVDNNTLNNILDNKLYKAVNIENMKKMNLKNNDIVLTMGYYTINDGGSAFYKIVDTESIEENNINIHQLKNGLKAELIINDSLNILQVGIKRNDSVQEDISEKIQKCLELYNNIFIPNGDYYINNTITIPPNTIIQGENTAKTIIIGNNFTDGFIFQSSDKSYDITIKNLTLISNNKLCGGIYLQASSNTNLAHFDVTHRLSNINMNNLNTGIKFDNCIRGTWLNNIKIYRSKTGFNLLGTDNFINNCVSGEIENEGFILSANNMLTNSKAFCCGSLDGKSAIKIIGGYNSLSGVHAQQNFGSGIEINSTSNYIDGVIDSNGYSTDETSIFESYNLIVNESKNIINVTSIDGRFNSSLNATLKITPKAHFNNINITLHSTKINVDDNKNKIIESYSVSTNNDIIINGEKYDSINDNNWRQLNTNDFIINEKHNSEGSYILNEKELNINILNYGNLAEGWGSTVRATLTENIYNENKNYIIIKTKVKVISDLDNSVFFRIAIANSKGNLIDNAILNYSGHMIGNAIKDYIIVIDLNKFREISINSNIPVIWFCLFKNGDSLTERNNASVYLTDLQYKII